MSFPLRGALTKMLQNRGLQRGSGRRSIGALVVVASVVGVLSGSHVLWQRSMVARLSGEIRKAVDGLESDRARPPHDVTVAHDRVRRTLESVRSRSWWLTGRSKAAVRLIEGKGYLRIRDSRHALRALGEAGRSSGEDPERAFALLQARTAIALAEREELRARRVTAEGDWPGLFKGKHAPGLLKAHRRSRNAAHPELLKAFAAWADERPGFAAEAASRVPAGDSDWALAKRLQAAALADVVRASPEEASEERLRTLEKAEGAYRELLERFPSDPGGRVGTCHLAVAALETDQAAGRDAWARLKEECWAISALFPNDPSALAPFIHASLLAFDQDAEAALSAAGDLELMARAAAVAAPKRPRSWANVGDALALQAELRGRLTDDDTRPLHREAKEAYGRLAELDPEASAAFVGILHAELELAVWESERKLSVRAEIEDAARVRSKLDDIGIETAETLFLEAVFELLQASDDIERSGFDPRLSSEKVKKLLLPLRSEGLLLEELTLLERLFEIETARWAWCRREPFLKLPSSGAPFVLDPSEWWGELAEDQRYFAALAKEQAGRIVLAKGGDPAGYVTAAREHLSRWGPVDSDERRNRSELARKIDQLEIRAALRRRAPVSALVEKARSACAADLASPLTRFHARFACAGTEMLLANDAQGRGRIDEARRLLAAVAPIVRDAVASAHGGMEGRVLDLESRLLALEVGAVDSSEAREAAKSDLSFPDEDERLMILGARLARFEARKAAEDFRRHTPGNDPWYRENADRSRSEEESLERQARELEERAARRADCAWRLFP